MTKGKLEGGWSTKKPGGARPECQEADKKQFYQEQWNIEDDEHVFWKCKVCGQKQKF